MLAQPITRRRWRKLRPRRTVWLPVDAAVQAGPAGILDQLGADIERVYLVGERPGGSHDGFTRWVTQPAPGWTPSRRGHYLDDTTLPVLRWRRDGGGEVEVHRAATWLGEGDYSAEQAEAAMTLVARALARVWRDESVGWLSTPATTGRDLILRSIPHEREYPTLPDDVQELIRSTSGQGRWQYLPPDADAVPRIEAWDMRFGYAALLWGLGCGPVEWDTCGEFAGYRRGRYYVTFRVPRGWGHVGLLGVPDDDGGWRWPDQPGDGGKVWADACEVYLAMTRGWPVTIHERLLWSDGRPLDGWQRRLVQVRDQLVRAWQSASDPELRAACRLAAAAVRRIVLTTIGAVHGRPHKISRVAPIAEADRVPVEATNVVLGDGTITWTEPRAPAWPELSHPEWSATVWARCRARMAHHTRSGTGALAVPRDAVLAIRQDALYLMSDPQWTDDGALGRLRRVSVTPGPIPTPRDPASMLRATRRTDR